MHHPKATHALPTQIHSRPESQVGDQDEVLKQPSQTVSIQGSASPKGNTPQRMYAATPSVRRRSGSPQSSPGVTLMRAIPSDQDPRSMEPARIVSPKRTVI